MRIQTLLVSTTFAITLSGSAMADLESGKGLHNESCVECHMMADHAALYTREKRVVNSLHDLGGQVSRCTQTLDINWFPDEEKDVIEYLNATYYKFKP